MTPLRSTDILQRSLHGSPTESTTNLYDEDAERQVQDAGILGADIPLLESPYNSYVFCGSTL
jgi:hypothetical protein